MSNDLSAFSGVGDERSEQTLRREVTSEAESKESPIRTRRSQHGDKEAAEDMDHSGLQGKEWKYCKNCFIFKSLAI